jgi:dienelactone hydrolase
MLAARLALAAAAVFSTLQVTPFKTIYYENAGLRLEAYLYVPTKGNGPFPVVIYNHGSRQGSERVERPFQFIGALLTDAGYAVLVPERRGYGKSEGQTFGEEVGADKGPKFIARMFAEADDVNASVKFLQTMPSRRSIRRAGRCRGNRARHCSRLCRPPPRKSPRHSCALSPRTTRRRSA